MSTIKNIELIDNIRTDALILMKNNPNMSYEEAYEKAKQNLIGDEKINSFEFKPFEVEVDESLISNQQPVEESKETKIENTEVKEEINNDNISEEEKKDLEILKELESLDVDYYENIRKQLSDIIDVTKFDNDQIEQLYIGQKMGVDITKIFNNKLTSQQIKFLCVMLATGRDITNYVINPDFDVEEAFAEIANQE